MPNWQATALPLGAGVGGGWNFTVTTPKHLAAAYQSIIEQDRSMKAACQRNCILPLALLVLVHFWAGALAQAQRNQAQGPRPRASAAPRNTPAGQGSRGRNAKTPVLLSPSAQQPGQPPAEFRLDAKQQKWVDDVVAFWERRTSAIKTYRCDFKRWEYDPVFGPKDPDTHKTESYGEIRYAAPDRGMIRVARTLVYDAKKAQAGDKRPYTEQKDQAGEHWVCDGKSVFEFDHRRKTLVETKLPPEMHGQAISESPLPFLFGAKAETIKRRYWLRELPAKGKPKFYQLEALPKRREDSGNFKRVRIFLDQQKYLPVGMQIVELNGQSKSSYQFYNIKENAVTDNLKDFLDSFVSPKPPLGWEKVTHNLGEPPLPVASKPEKSRQARKPTKTTSPKR